ncbi:hypothetical protein GOBAR_DD35692 [Gossypium barbadense]|nr:hypothetical protein GOBAR_DD35692 [Gossypium barbadense]
MAPRKQQCATQAPSNLDANRFHNTKFEWFFLQMSECSFIQECGFYPAMYACDEIWNLDFDMEGIINYLTEGHGKWTRQTNFEVPLKFNRAIMSPMAKIWMKFICSRLMPTHNASNVIAYRAIMLYSFME